MSPRRSIALACAVWVTSAGAAWAGKPIVTPALRLTGTAECLVLNNKAAPVTDVTIDIVGANGTVIASIGPLTLQPNDERAVIWVTGPTLAYCRVSRSTGGLSKRNTLVTLCARRGTTRDFPCQATVTSP